MPRAELRKTLSKVVSLVFMAYIMVTICLMPILDVEVRVGPLEMVWAVPLIWEDPNY